MRYTRGETFNSPKDADTWLDRIKSEISLELWKPPSDRPVTDSFGPYAFRWLEHRDLELRTRVHYQQVLNDHILP